jgi:hypothetical protein
MAPRTPIRRNRDLPNRPPPPTRKSPKRSPTRKSPKRSPTRKSPKRSPPAKKHTSPRRSPVKKRASPRRADAGFTIYTDGQLRTPTTPSSKLLFVLKVFDPEVTKSDYYSPGEGWHKEDLVEDLRLFVLKSSKIPVTKLFRAYKIMNPTIKKSNYYFPKDGGWDRKSLAKDGRWDRKHLVDDLRIAIDKL